MTGAFLVVPPARVADGGGAAAAVPVGGRAVVLEDAVLPLDEALGDTARLLL